MSEEASTPRKRFHISKITIILVVALVAAISIGIFFFFKYQEAQGAASKNTQIVEKVAKTIQLPEETPVVVTVADKTRLSNKQLATKVENDDVMLIFAKAKRLVVYRPSTEKVADVLSFSPSEQLPTATKK